MSQIQEEEILEIIPKITKKNIMQAVDQMLLYFLTKFDISTFDMIHEQEDEKCNKKFKSMSDLINKLSIYIYKKFKIIEWSLGYQESRDENTRKILNIIGYYMPIFTQICFDYDDIEKFGEIFVKCKIIPYCLNKI